MNQIIIFCATYFIYIGAIYVILFFLFKRGQQHRIRHIVITLGTAVLAWIIAHVLKDIIAHPRPDLVGALVVPDSFYSFPSGHATFLFALAWSMCKFDKRSGVIIFIFGVVSGIARVLAGIHFWYDIAGGFVLGVIVAYGVLFIIKNIRS